MIATILGAWLALPGSLLSGPTLAQVSTVTINHSGFRTNADAVFALTNSVLPVYRVAPAPVSIATSLGIVTLSGADLVPGTNGNELVTMIYTNAGGRRVGHQKAIGYPSGDTFTNYLSGTLNADCWAEYIATTNGKNNNLWASRTPGAATWDASSMIQTTTNFTALSFGWEGQSYPGEIPITAISRWIGYSRGHGMTAGTNTANAGKQVWFLTAANVIVTNTIAEQITSQVGGDYTLFRFTSELPTSIKPLPMAGPDYATKRPHLEDTPFPEYNVTIQANKFGTGVAPFVRNAVGGDSGSAAMARLGNRLIFLHGATTTGYSLQMSNHLVNLLQRGGLSLTNFPTVENFNSYPTP